MSVATQTKPPSYEELLDQNDFLSRQVKILSDDIARLEEMNRHLLRKRFSSSSEVHSSGQGTLFNESEFYADEDDEAEEGKESSDEAGNTEPKRDGNKNRGKPVRNPLPTSLPRVEKVIDLAKGQKSCPYSGQPLSKIGEERSEKLEIKPAKVFVTEYVRPKYAACRCEKCGATRDSALLEGKEAEPQIKIADPEPQAIPKSMASASLLSYIATAKFSDALPLYRLEAILKRAGITIPRATLANWMIKCGALVQPLLNLMHEELLSLPILQCDETRVLVLKSSGKKKGGNSYMWVLLGIRKDGSTIVLYELGPSRAHTVPMKLLEGYSGYLHVDGYNAYETLGRKMPQIKLVGDWVHVRRRFDDAVKAHKDAKKEPKAKQALDMINDLFRIEREMPQGVTDFEKKKIRQEKSKLIVESLKKWLDETTGTVPPKTLTGKAISYALERWPRLLPFLDDPILRLDTNPVENAIRPFVMGRKAWLFADTEKGARASASLYSLVVTAKANGHDPFVYLENVFEKIPRAETLDDIEALLPWRWTPP